MLVVMVCMSAAGPFMFTRQCGPPPGTRLEMSGLSALHTALRLLFIEQLLTLQFGKLLVLLRRCRSSMCRLRRTLFRMTLKSVRLGSARVVK